MHKLEKREDQPADSPIAYLSNSEDSVKQHITSTWSLFKNWPLMSSIVLFCIACFDDMAYTEVRFILFKLLAISLTYWWLTNQNNIYKIYPSYQSKFVWNKILSCRHTVYSLFDRIKYYFNPSQSNLVNIDIFASFFVSLEA